MSPGTNLLHGRRVLVCGAVYPPGTGGGIPLALSDLSGTLSARGWTVDLAITPAELALPEHVSRPAVLTPWSAPGWRLVPRLRFLPEHMCTALQHILLDGGAAHVQSALIDAIGARLERQQYDAVIAYVSREAPGFARFILGAHPNVLLVSLNGLALELRLAAWLRAARLSGRIAAAGRLHPCLYHAVDPGTIRMAIFASDSWRQQAVRAGLSAGVARTIYFGVRSGPPLEDPRPVDGKLLWVGRCSPEKGLHHFVEAVAVLRRTRPVTLTAVCAPGPGNYLRFIVKRIERYGLRDAIRLIPPVPRAQLRDMYRSHDALLFYSIFAEPVALVLVEAFAAGIPVVAPAPPEWTLLIEPDQTCVCFRTTAAHDVAAAVQRTLDDTELRRRVRRAARDLVVHRFSLDATGDAYEAALEETVGRAVRLPGPPSLA